MANCDLSKTVRKELKLMFNIRKPDRFHKKVSFLLKKSSLPFKIVNLDGFRLIQRTLFGLAEFSCLYKVALRSNKLVMKWKLGNYFIFVFFLYAYVATIYLVTYCFYNSFLVLKNDLKKFMILLRLRGVPPKKVLLSFFYSFCLTKAKRLKMKTFLEVIVASLTLRPRTAFKNFWQNACNFAVLMPDTHTHTHTHTHTQNRNCYSK